MRGQVRARGRCRCGGKWIEERVRQKVLGLSCEWCAAIPTKIYVDARGFRDRTGNVGRIGTDDQGRSLSYLAAERLLQAISADYDRNPKGFVVAKWGKKQRRGYLLSDAGGRWIEMLYETCSKTYADHQKIFLRHVERHMGDVDVREIRAGHVEDLYRALLPEYAVKTVQSILLALRTLLNWMKRREELERVPAFPEVRVPTRIVRWITRPEQDKVVVEAPERYRLLFRVLIETGIRPGEAVALAAGDVQEGGIVVCKALGSDGKIKETKAGKIQFKRVSAELYAGLEMTAKGKLPGAFLFPMPDGRPIKVNNLSHIWKAAAEKTGVDAPLYEGTRHSFATRLRQEKEAAMGKELAQEMGHHSGKFTMKTYAPNKRREG